MLEFLTGLVAEFQRVIIDGDRYKFIITGLQNTFVITFGALAIGIILGILVAAIRTSFDKNKEAMKLRGGIGYYILAVLNAICKFYLTVTRGTPVVVQLMISYFVIFASADNGVFVAIFAFGINSGAYVAEIARSGLMSINVGQTEAGRSLGFNYMQTMWYIIIPQAIKNILPALGNEMITLLKDTSLVSVIALRDVTKQAQNIVSKTYQAYVPYLTLAAIYLVIVIILTKLLGILERRLRKSDH